MVFYDDFLISREVTKITSIYYLCRVKNRTAMKRNILRIAIAACIAAVFVQACEKLEPSTYSETFYRVATVQLKNGKASLLIDYTGEAFNFSNFNTAADLTTFGVQDSDRVIAEMTVSAIGNITNNKLTLDKLYKYPTLSVAESRPSDSANYRYMFDNLNLYSMAYPMIWAQGHIINLTPSYITSSGNKSPEFKLYPLEVNKDTVAQTVTLVMQLYAAIPEQPISSWEAAQTLLCYDISTLRDSVADPAENHYRDSLMNLLTKANYSTIDVQVYSADTLREMWDTTEGVLEKKYLAIPRPSVTVSIPFDF